MSTVIQELEAQEQALRDRSDSLRLAIRQSEETVTNVETWLAKSGLDLTMDELKNGASLVEDMTAKLEKLITSINDKLEVANELVQELEATVNDQ